MIYITVAVMMVILFYLGMGISVGNERMYPDKMIERLLIALVCIMVFGPVALIIESYFLSPPVLTAFFYFVLAAAVTGALKILENP